MDIKYNDFKNKKVSKKSEFEALRMQNFRNEMVKRMKQLDEMWYQMGLAGYSEELQQQIYDEANKQVEAEYQGVFKDDN